MTLNVGDASPFTIDDLYLLPIGSTITSSSSTLVRTIDGFRADPSYAIAPGDLLQHGWRVASIGSVGVAESLHQYQHRLWTMALGHATIHGISLAHVDEALAAVGVGFRPDLYPQMWVHTRHAALISALPAGTVLVAGDPTNHANYGWFNERGQHLAGRWSSWRESTIARVMAYPPGTVFEAWPSEEPEVEAIAAFRRRLWRDGLAFKTSRRWCGAYESLVWSMFSHESIAAEPEPVDPDARGEVDGPVTRALMDAAPVGSRVYDTGMPGHHWERNVEGRWVFSDGGSTSNAADFSVGTLRWRRWGTGSTVEPDPLAPLPGEQVVQAQAERAPVGSRFRDIHMEVEWELRDDGHWCEDGHSSGALARNFAHSTLRWVRWGPATTAPASGYRAVLSVAEANALPVGSLIGYSSPAESPGNWNYMIRTAVHVTDRTATEHFTGPNSGRFTTGATYLIHRAGDEVAIPVETHDQLHRVGIGSVIRAGRGEVLYVKEDERRWRQVGGTAHGTVSDGSPLALGENLTTPPVFVCLVGAAHTIGEPLVLNNLQTTEQFARLPDGTRISHGDNLPYTKRNGAWQNIQSGDLSPRLDGWFSVCFDDDEEVL